MIEFTKELIKYKEELNLIIKSAKEKNIKLDVEFTNFKKNKAIPIEFEKLIDEHFGDDDDSANFMKRFLTDYSWWNGGKTVDRADYYVSPILQSLELVNLTQAYIADIAYKYATCQSLASEAIKLFNIVEEDLKDEDEKYESIDINICGSNILYFGAPGTGKSNKIDEKLKLEGIKENFVERVVFYPEYSHDDFIGAYMPCMAYEKNESAYLSESGQPIEMPGKPVPYYTFVAGPFTRAFIKAKKNSKEKVVLIIEELNRADAASVFGEMFQLLDRCVDGTSVYEISISNEYAQFLEKELHGLFKKDEKLKIPPNLSIWATMNSADQGVRVIDTAFKRRWNFEYMPINFELAKHKNYEIDYAGGKITWKELGEWINNKLLMDIGVNEDKCLGQYFINEEEIKDINRVASKILFYLYDDAAKYNHDVLFGDNKTLSELITGFIGGDKIFRDLIPSKVTSHELIENLEMDTKKEMEIIEEEDDEEK